MLPLLLALACTGEPDLQSRPFSPTGSTDWSTPSVYTGLSLEGLACADPAARTQAFDRHTLPALPSAASNLVGGGVTAADFDGDGQLDLVLTGQLGAEIWRGTGATDTPFERTDWLDGIATAQSVGAVAADLSADGRPDLVLTRYGQPNLILRNDDGVLVPATPPELLAHRHRTQAAAVADLDGDGDLDLFFGSYGDRPSNSNDPQMAPADPAELYRNDGGLWTDLSDTLPQEVHDGYTFTAAFLDRDEDGLPEGYLAHDFGSVRPSVRLENRGDMRFVAHADWHPGEDMGMSAGDVDGDGHFEFLITSASDVYAVTHDGTRWYDTAGAWALHVEPQEQHQYFGWGAEWADLDNDADLDAIALMGHWSDWLTPTGQRDALWLQIEGSPPVFAQVGDDPFWGLDDDGPGRGLLVTDLNGDGWLDVVKRQVGEPTLIDLSRCGEAHRLLVRLESPGANTQGLGARVVIQAGGRVQTRWVQTGGAALYGGAPPVAHFGLGDSERIDHLAVHWPDGSTQESFDLPADVALTVVQSP